MRKDRRLFGNNFKLFLWKSGYATKDFAKQIGCSEYTLYQVMDARLILDTAEEENIADALQIPLEDFYVEHSAEEYEAAGCMECRGRFSNQENKKLVLDLLDVYCDIQEIMADEAV